MANPFKTTVIKADTIKRNGGPVYDATLDEIENMPELLRSLNSTVVPFGDVVVRPPYAWKRPLDSSILASNVECSKQRLPHPPFARTTKTREGSGAATSADDEKDEEGFIHTEIPFGARRKESMETFRMKVKVMQNQIVDNTGLPSDNTDTATILPHYESGF